MTLYESPEALSRIFGGSGLDLTDERARLARQQADAQELRNAEARGELIPSADVEAALIAVTSPIARALDGLHIAAAPEIRAARSDAEGAEVLKRRVERIRYDLADLGAAYSEKLDL